MKRDQILPHKKIYLNGVPISWYDISLIKVEHTNKASGRVEVYLCDGEHRKYESVNLKELREQIDITMQKARLDGEL